MSYIRLADAMYSKPLPSQAKMHAHEIGWTMDADLTEHMSLLLEGMVCQKVSMTKAATWGSEAGKS